MFSRGGFDAMTGQQGRVGVEEAIDSLVALAKDNPDKAHVMAYFGQLVADGFAVWEKLENGEIEVRFSSGEIYLLAETTILRLA